MLLIYVLQIEYWILKEIVISQIKIKKIFDAERS